MQLKCTRAVLMRIIALWLLLKTIKLAVKAAVNSFVDQSNSFQHYTTLLHNATLNEAKMRTMAKTDNTTRYSIWPRGSPQLLPFRFFKTYSSSTSRGQGNFWPSSRVHWIASLFFIFNSNVVNVVGQLIGVHRHLQIQIKFNKIIEMGGMWRNKLLLK